MIEKAILIVVVAHLVLTVLSMLVRVALEERRIRATTAAAEALKLHNKLVARHVDTVAPISQRAKKIQP